VAGSLSHVLGRIVIDKTGFSGTFDIHLEVRLDEALGGFPGPPPRRPDDSAPSIFTALQEQLGLRPEAGRAPIEVLVIDNVERPTGN
jgi:uncharacterized protein (TIGR03435 family)